MQDKSNKKVKRSHSEAARIFIVITALVGCITLAVGGAAEGRLLNIGRGLALLSVGIMQPEGGVQVLSERLERIPAQGGMQQRDVLSDLSYAPIGGVLTSGELASSKIIPSGIVPPEAGDGGKIIEQMASIGSNFVQGVSIKNVSSRTIDVAAQLKISPDIKIKKSADPQVLIMHTHTTESYMTYYAGYYNAEDSARSKDDTRSVVAVGEAVSAQLRAANIGVIHNVTLHDSPKYTGAYERAEKTIKKILKQYPTISVIIDLHRDAMNKSKTEKYKPTVMVNGRKAAQIMIVTSVCHSSAFPHPDWVENLRLSLRLQSSLHTRYYGIVRPLYLVDSRYNQNLSHGSLLIEVGTDANTVSEAVYSGEILGKTLAQVLILI
ncbi:MAG: stage II sporulation protein P [Oscillospiraceae bacterium]|nr:stage II sporulation protein P [Oscillospiraceae bacterium]MDD4413309.1 stage II sporulation protein P [Oscillospiraceae bacterium]